MPPRVRLDNDAVISFRLAKVHLRKRSIQSGNAPPQMRETEFRRLHSQTEFGNEA